MSLSLAETRFGVMDLDVAQFASLLHSVWWKHVYRHVRPVFKAMSAPEDGEAVDGPPDIMTGQPRLWGGVARRDRRALARWRGSGTIRWRSGARGTATGTGRTGAVGSMMAGAA